MSRFYIAAGASLVFLVAGGSSALASTYAYTGAAAGTVISHSSCAVGPCADYVVGSSHVTGSFTTATPLPANQGLTTVTPTSYSFTDGINTISDSDPSSHIVQFLVGTDASGQVNTYALLLSRWQTGSSPHATPDRVAWLNVGGGGNHSDSMVNNALCTAVAADACTGYGTDGGSSAAGTPGAGSWQTIAPAIVPSLAGSAWALLTLLLGVTGLTSLKARRQRA